jgi:nucleoid-associated protein YgaU
MRIAFHWCGGLKSGVLVSLILGCAAASFAQDLGEIARQERERKKEQPDRAAYVYTNDDLQRAHILVPEDKARALAAREAASKPATQVAQTPVAPVAAAPVVAASSPASIPTQAVSVATQVVATSLATSPAVPPARPAPVSSSVAFSAPPEIASAKDVTAEPKASPLQAILELVHEQEASTRETSAQKHSGALARRSAQPAAADIPFDVRPSPAAEKKTARRETATPAPSPAAFSTPRRHSEVREPEPFDLGMPDVVTVQPGDSLWKLARHYLGSGRRWRELAALNTQIFNANVLHVGEWICLPAGNLQNAGRITPRARAPASVVQKIAQKIVPKNCPDHDNSERFVVTAEPLGGPLRRGSSPSRCTSTP